MLYSLGDKVPRTETDQFWIAPNATLIGDILLEADASVWWGAVLRGDTERITVGRGSNVQDNAVLHTDAGFPLVIGAHVTVGHQAMLHGCTIGDGSLIGIGAVVLDGARIGRNCLIGAKALVGQGKIIPDNSLVLGVPGKVVGTVTSAQAEMLRHGSIHYVENWRRYAGTLKPVELPDTEAR